MRALASLCRASLFCYIIQRLMTLACAAACPKATGAHVERCRRVAAQSVPSDPYAGPTSPTSSAGAAMKRRGAPGPRTALPWSRTTASDQVQIGFKAPFQHPDRVEIGSSGGSRTAPWGKYGAYTHNIMHVQTQTSDVQAMIPSIQRSPKLG